MFLLPAKFLFLLAVTLEVVVTLLVAQAIGLLWTFVWLLAAFVLGLVVLKRAGTRAWRTLSTVAREPARMAGDGPVVGPAALMFLAGGLLVVPGVLSDVAGLVLLTPLGSALVNRAVDRRVGRYVTVVRTGTTFVDGRWRRVDGSVADPSVQAGELVEDHGSDDPERDPRDP